MADLKIRYGILLSFLLVVITAACRKDAWDDHSKISNQDISHNLFEQISSNSDLSKFTDFLIKTRYDSVLRLSRSFTVWAPSNKALESLDQAIVNNPARLKLFVANHISNQSYFTDMTNANGILVKALNHKNTLFSSTEFEGAKITSSNTFVSNGVLHVIDNYAVPKPNAFEFMLSTSNGLEQKTFIQSLYHTEIDTSKGVKLYNDPITKKPVYQEGTTFPVVKNYYFQKVADLSSEDSLFTYFVLTDEAFAAEESKLKPYFSSDQPGVQSIETKWSVVKDLVVNGIHPQAELGQPMTSVNGVQFTVNPSDVIETRKLSNGIAYVIKGLSYELLKNKIPTIIIQGEYPDSLRVPRNPTYKIKQSSNGERFTDIQVSGITSVPDPIYHLKYKRVVNSVKYKVYWRAVNDLYTSPVSMNVQFNRVPIFTKDPLPGVGYHSVPFLDDAKNPEFYKEVFLGEYTSEKFGDLFVFLSSSLSATSTTPTALTLDYLKLEPAN